MNTHNHRFAYLIAAAIVAVIVFYLGYGCNREDQHTTAPISKPETARLTKAQADSIRREAYVQKDAEYRPQITALERSLSAERSKYKPKQEKAARSASTFANSGKLEDCKVALTDCQEEAHAAAQTLAVADSLIALQKAQRVNDSTEIVASHKAAQDFNAGWAEANAENAKLRKQNGKKWALGVGVGYGLTPNGPGPVISVGVQRNLFRF